MKVLMRFQGLLSVTALMLLYPAFQVGQMMGDALAELPQAFHERPGSVVFGFALNVLIVGAVTWATCFRKRRVEPQTKS